MELQQLQAEVSQWAEHNFAPIRWHWPILGMIEELGELCDAAQTDGQAVMQMMQHVGKLAHLHLKEEEGKRQDGKAFLEQCEHANALESILGWYVTGSDQGGPEPVDNFGFMKDAVADLLIFMLCFCHRMGWDLSEIVEQVWSQVKHRDWKKYPQNGVSA